MDFKVEEFVISQPTMSSPRQFNFIYQKTVKDIYGNDVIIESHRETYSLETLESQLKSLDDQKVLTQSKIDKIKELNDGLDETKPK